MDERVLRQRVGVVVLAAALITAFLVARFGDLPLPGAGTYTVYIKFPRAPGIEAGTPVRISGVQIGRVTKIELVQPSGVLVTTEIDKGRTLLDSFACLITTASVLGDSIIEFIPPDPLPPGSLAIEDRTLITNGQVAGNPLEMASTLAPQIQGALDSFTRATGQVELTARKLNTAIDNNEDQIPRIMQKAERALDQFGIAMSGINESFGDPQTRADLKQSLRQLPGTLNETRNTLMKANEAFDGFKVMSDRAARNLENLENFTKPLGEKGPQLVDNLDGSLANVNELLEHLVLFTDGLNSREGSLGRLLHDDTIYRRLDHALANAEDITSRIKPILDDIRIFSDKIARDPRQLGVKGALDRRPSGSGQKASVSHHLGPPPGDAVYLDENGDWDPVVLPHK